MQSLTCFHRLPPPTAFPPLARMPHACGGPPRPPDNRLPADPPLPTPAPSPHPIPPLTPPLPLPLTHPPPGVIPIAHNSGGPRADIVVPVEGPDGPQITGYLAESPEEYCDAITRVLVMDQVDRLHIAAAAQRHAAKFSTENFTLRFLEAMGPVVPGVGGGVSVGGGAGGEECSAGEEGAAGGAGGGKAGVGRRTRRA